MTDHDHDHEAPPRVQEPAVHLTAANVLALANAAEARMTDRTLNTRNLTTIKHFVERAMILHSWLLTDEQAKRMDRLVADAKARAVQQEQPALPQQQEPAPPAPPPPPEACAMPEPWAPQPIRPAAAKRPTPPPMPIPQQPQQQPSLTGQGDSLLDTF